MEHTASKKILFLPFLQIPSGHYQAAKAIMDGIAEKQPKVECEVVDILSYTFGKMEKAVSQIYLRWIHTFPRLYSLVYRLNVNTGTKVEKQFKLYEWLFLKAMRNLLDEKTPDLIVCTHGLPSYLLNILKGRGEVHVPVVNVYTDYFIHQVWGKKSIDFHFAPTKEAGDFLASAGISENRIYVTGIPIHPSIRKKSLADKKKNSSRLSVLVTGGSLGIGSIEQTVSRVGERGGIQYSILCGTNKGLYERLKALGKRNVKPLEYIRCRKEMNKLYDSVDAIVTKPGGVTLSECLFKRLPIFIFHALPGQEEFNLQTLEKLGVIMRLDADTDGGQEIERHIAGFFKNSRSVEKYKEKVNNYLETITPRCPEDIVLDLLYGEK
ncbi:MGDG synthase family glycosyltransferase [Bacillus sp. FJAT-27245]|uniref:MGDG synthase family glycosyltransferase n=1 Tax=Bacillus sp. FJAT-27245 TaxID=1684144 RepID=UPI0006A7B6FC|nr:glycosyltransferase [Bacillus sp. FJAT-27245]